MSSMNQKGSDAERIEHLLDTPDLADALESDRFKQFLDHVPIAIAVAELQPIERIVYANLEFERLTGQSAGDIEGLTWDILSDSAQPVVGDVPLNRAVQEGEEYLGLFHITRDAVMFSIDAWSNVIEDDDGKPTFRLVAMAETGVRSDAEGEALEQRIRDKDTLLRELQHRVKNNLQMITALIRLEARNVPDNAAGDRFQRLAGRIEALALLYRSLSDEEMNESVDLGVYLSEIASAVMRAHAVEGIRLDLKVDTWPVSVNVAMPTGLVVNELLTNALKHAFQEGQGGTITLHSLVDERGCTVVVADDGIGLAEDMRWPKAGKLGALIVQSLRQNALAKVDVESRPGAGVRVTIFFARANAV